MSARTDKIVTFTILFFFGAVIASGIIALIGIAIGALR